MAKSYGQIAYEAFQVAFWPNGVEPIAWHDCRPDVQRACHEAAKAVCEHAADFLGKSHMPEVIDVAGGLRGAEPMGAVYGRALLANETSQRG